MKIGYFLSSEEFGPKELVEQAVKAQLAGFQDLWISDHYHPWNDEQGHSAFAAKIGDGFVTVGPEADSVPTPAHFDQASQLVSEDAASEDVPCGPDLERHMMAIRAYDEAGFDELYIQQIGPNQDEFFRVYRENVLPQFGGDRELAPSGST